MTTLESILNTFTHLLGLDLFIETMSLDGGPFSLSSTVHSGGDREWWGLGLHIVASPLQVSPR